MSTATAPSSAGNDPPIKTIDVDAFPHILDSILSYTEWHDLFKWRQTSRSICARIDQITTTRLDVREDFNWLRISCLASPYGSVPALCDHMYRWHHGAEALNRHEDDLRDRMFSTLVTTKVLDVYSPLAASEALGRPIPDHPGKFSRLTHVRLHPSQRGDFSHHCLAFTAPTLVVFCNMNVRVLLHKHEFPSGGLLRLLPTTFIPRATSKLVLNITYVQLAYHFDKALWDDNDVIPVTVAEIVFVFSNCGPKPRGQPDWAFDQNVEELRKWLVKFVLHTVATGRRDVVFVDFEKVDFKWWNKVGPFLTKPLSSPPRSAFSKRPTSGRSRPSTPNKSKNARTCMNSPVSASSLLNLSLWPSTRLVSRPDS